MRAFLPRRAAAIAAAAVTSLAFGCGSTVMSRATDALPPENRAALPGDSGATVRATIRLSGRHLQHVTGSRASSIDDLDAVAFYLVEAPRGTPLSGEVGAVAGSDFTYTLDADNRIRSQIDLHFSNVPANATGQAYFLAVTATADGIDITNAAAPVTIGGRRCYVSDEGGSLAAPGSVRVETVSYALDATAPLSVGLKLGDATAAILEAGVTVTDGGAPP